MAMDFPQGRGASLVASRRLPKKHEVVASQACYKPLGQGQRQQSNNSQGPTRPRKKLQKSDSQQRKHNLGRRPRSGASYSYESKENTPAGASKLAVSTSQAHPPQQSSPPPRLPALSTTSRHPDFSDAKWAEYLRRSGVICTTEPSPAQSNESLDRASRGSGSSSKGGSKSGSYESSTNTTTTTSICNTHKTGVSLSLGPSAIVPEFSRLVSAVGAKPQRPSIDTENRGPPDLPAFPSSSVMMRRRAKTPVLAIGQLEQAGTTTLPSQIAVAVGRPQQPHPAKHRKMPSFELLAEEYRTLLQSRDSVGNSTLTESHSEPPPSRLEEREPHGLRRHHSSGGLQRMGGSGPSPLENPPPLDLSVSPATTSDDGTLVAFEEETIYFKPMSFSPEPPLSPSPSSPPHWQYYSALGSPLYSPTHDPTRGDSATAPDSLSLQICVDLLTRELSSVARGARQPTKQSAAEQSSLQVWVMIEAYERLRDQLLCTNHDGAHPLFPSEELRRPVEAMFDVWLRALYAIHHSEVFGGQRPRSATNFDLGAVLQSEDLD